jgi:hypothetical protein
MARPQVADEGDGLRHGGELRIYRISSGEQPTRGGPPAWGLGVGLTTPHRKKISLLQKFSRSLRPGRIPWINVFENRVLRGIFRPKRDEMTIGWRKLHNEELHNLYSSAFIMRMIKSRRMGWAGHVTRVGCRGMNIGYWWESQKIRRPLGRPRCR